MDSETGIPAEGLASAPGATQRYDLRIFDAMRRIMREADAYSRRLAQNEGVTVPQLVCLTKLHERGAMTLSELAQAVGSAPSTLVGIIDRLEAHGLLTRQRRARDRRQVQLVLTESGAAKALAAPSPLQDRLLEAVGTLSELERAVMALSLEKIVAMMDTTDRPRAAYPKRQPAAAPAPPLDPNALNPGNETL